MFDLLIRNVMVIDGSGSAGYRGNVAVADGRIAAVGDIGGETERVMDGSDLVAAPGFIDIHSHTDTGLFVDPRAQSKITQGITLELGGNCGFSSGPYFDEAGRSELESWRRKHNIEENWQTLGEMLSAMEGRDIAINFATLVGHSNLRSAVVGLAAREATPDEIEQMKRLAAQAMEEGAFGISSGLIYPPSCFGDTNELGALASATAPHGGFYASHIRSEREAMKEAVAEAIEIGRLGGVPVQIAHHKACGSTNWGMVKQTLEMIYEARDQGIDVTVDQYPYTASATSLTILLPNWAHDGGDEALVGRLKNQRAELFDHLHKLGEPGGSISSDGGWHTVLVSSVRTDANRRFEGMNLVDIAKARGTGPEDTVLDLLTEESAAVSMVHFAQCEEDIKTVMLSSVAMIGTDASARSTSGEMARGKPHPRSFGSFPRVLGRYVREQQVIPIETAIHKMTGMPARKLGLADRGLLKPGFWADMVLFDPETIIDNATYENPHQISSGIDCVFVNGQLTVEQGEMTGAYAGRVLRRNSAASSRV